MKIHTVGLATLISGALILGTAAMSTAAQQEAGPEPAARARVKIALGPSSQPLAGCFPKATLRFVVRATHRHFLAVGLRR